jgi:hypothetical protein
MRAVSGVAIGRNIGRNKVVNQTIEGCDRLRKLCLHEFAPPSASVLICSSVRRKTVGARAKEHRCPRLTFSGSN